MKLSGRAPRITRLSPVLLGSLIVLIAMDLFYVATYAINLRAYHLAPNNGALVPGDDPGYFVTGLVATGTSLLRDAILLLAAVAIALQFRRLRKVGGRVTPTLTAAVTALSVVAIGVEIVRVQASWQESNPTHATLYVVVAACVLNAAVVVALAFVFAYPIGRGRDAHAPA